MLCLHWIRGCFQWKERLVRKTENWGGQNNHHRRQVNGNLHTHHMKASKRRQPKNFRTAAAPCSEKVSKNDQANQFVCIPWSNFWQLFCKRKGFFWAERLTKPFKREQLSDMKTGKQNHYRTPILQTRNARLCYLLKKIDNRQSYFIIEREIFEIWMGAQLVFIIEIICIWCVGEYWSFYLKKKPCYQKNYGQSYMFSLPFAALCFTKLYYALMKLPMQGRQNKSLLNTSR